MRIIELNSFEFAYLEQALLPEFRKVNSEGIFVMPGGDLGFKRVFKSL